ncbi:MAG: hypothetical protein M9932_13845 [Xanthobacteraceae bacterium]|nr:hypothetical protein [Xanthobacteraceae bacterium]
MADYYPLIARAISGLDASAPGESRRALYERARSALIAQLRSVQPPLTESEITRERLSLEEAIRKVESEAAQRARELARTDSKGRPRPGDALRAGSRAATTRHAERDAAKSADAPPPRPSFLESRPAPAAPEEPAAEQRPARPPRLEPHDHAPPAHDPAPPVARERGGIPRRDTPTDHPVAGSDDSAESHAGAPGVRGFRDVVADADDLGRATAKANRAARRTYANVPSPSPEFDRLEPSMEDRGVGAPVSYDYDEGIEEAYEPPPARPRGRGDKRRRVNAGGGFPFKAAIIVGLVLILAGAGILWGQKGLTYVRGLVGKQAAVTTQAPKTTPAAPPPKIADRVGQPGSSDAVAPVAQRVVLYDEDPNDPKGRQYVGSVIWRTEPVKGADGKPDDIAVRADIEIPERKLKMTMSFRRNTDTSLPASHTAELTFVLPPDFDNGTVANVPGILMKSNEQARGTPLAGLAVKVTDGFFLIGLSNVESDRARNLQLLKERSWFDIPLVYSNQRRAIIAIEKGAPGERAFNAAFMAWGE